MKKASKPLFRNTRRKRAGLAKFGHIAAGASLLLSGAPAYADDAPLATAENPKGGSIIDKPIEELMGMNYIVTSASKRPDTVLDAAASIFVITGEDIRRSGVTSIPEALRLSPGVEVARQDAHTWAICSRGF